MTTLVGICAENGNKGVILASDLASTREEWKPEGDIAYREQTRIEAQKIHVSDNKRLAVAMTGTYDSAYVQFLTDLLKGKLDFEKSIKDGFFQAFMQMHLDRFGGLDFDMRKRSGLLVATRFNDDPSLYKVLPAGKVIQVPDWSSIGSGSDHAARYMGTQKDLIPGYIDLSRAVDLAVASLDVANQDIYTSGLDIVSITPNGIIEFGDKIRAGMDRARKGIIARIKKQL